MKLGSLNYLRRFLVNGILGAAIVVPLWLMVTGTYIIGADQVTILDWKSANWVWVGIVALHGAATFQYLSVRYARTRSWQSMMLIGVTAWGGAIFAMGMVDAVCFLLGKTVVPTPLSIVTVALAGCTLGVALWTRANAVNLHHLFNASSER